MQQSSPYRTTTCSEYKSENLSKFTKCCTAPAPQANMEGHMIVHERLHASNKQAAITAKRAAAHSDEGCLPFKKQMPSGKLMAEMKVTFMSSLSACLDGEINLASIP